MSKCKCSGVVAAIDSRDATSSPEDDPMILPENHAPQLVASSPVQLQQTAALPSQDGTITYNKWDVHVDRAVFVNAQDMGAQVRFDGVQPQFTIDNVVGSLDMLSLQDNGAGQRQLEEIVDQPQAVEEASSRVVRTCGVQLWDAQV